MADQVIQESIVEGQVNPGEEVVVDSVNPAQEGDAPLAETEDRGEQDSSSTEEKASFEEDIPDLSGEATPEINLDEVEKEISSEPDSTYVLNGYNLEPLKELGVDFENEDQRASLENLVKVYKEQGFDEKQTTFAIAATVSEIESFKESLRNEDEKYYSKESSQDRLNQALTSEEKQNYNPMAKWAQEINKEVGGSERELIETLREPYLAKILIGAFKNAQSKGNLVNDTSDTTTQMEEKITAQEGLKEINTWARSIAKFDSAEAEAKKEDIRAKIEPSELEAFDKFAKSLLK